jgi:predicted outer membrane repeat protein
MLAWTSVYGADWYVDPSVSDGDGSSWDSAFQTIQEAVDASSSALAECEDPTDQIHVRQGTYNRTSPIEISKYVTILGGYNDEGVRDWQNSPSIIDGQNETGCLIITGPCIFDGFVIRNGFNAVAGGGLYINSTPEHCLMDDFYRVPKIRNCRIEYNTAGTGGGIYDLQSNTEIENCTFQGNTAGAGGGVFHASSSVTIEKCIFLDNDATDPSSIGGGAIAGVFNHPVTEGLTHIINSLFHGNTAESWGGAIATTHIYPRIWNCTFYDNGAGISGGAYHNNTYSDAPFVRNSIFWENSPDQLDVVTANTHYYVSQSVVQGGWEGRGEENSVENPGFVSPETGDFHLMPGSPCIDEGYSWGMPEEDLDGRLRPHDGNDDGEAEWDIGAYEFYGFTPLPGPFRKNFGVNLRNLPAFRGSIGPGLGGIKATTPLAMSIKTARSMKTYKISQ